MFLAAVDVIAVVMVKEGPHLASLHSTAAIANMDRLRYN